MKKLFAVVAVSMCAVAGQAQAVVTVKSLGNCYLNETIDRYMRTSSSGIKREDIEKVMKEQDSRKTLHGLAKVIIERREAGVSISQINRETRNLMSESGASLSDTLPLTRCNTMLL